MCLPFILQLLQPSIKILQTERKVLGRLTGSPANALPTGFLHKQKEIGAPCNFRSVAALSKATKLRTALRTCTVWKLCCQQLQCARMDENIYLNFVQKPIQYDYLAFAVILESAATCAGSNSGTCCDIRKLRRESQSLTSIKFQQRAYQIYIVRETTFDFEAFFARRMARFSFLCGGASGEELAKRTIFATKSLRKSSPNVFYAVAKTWTNAWVSARRFQAKGTMACHFGCVGEHDEIEHYLVCKQIRKAHELIFGKAISAEGILCISYDSDNDFALKAAFTYCLFKSHAMLHSEERITSREVGCIRGKMKFLEVHCSATSKALAIHRAANSKYKRKR